MNYRLLNRGWISEYRASRVVNGLIILFVLANIYWANRFLHDRAILVDSIQTAVTALLGVHGELLFHGQSGDPLKSPNFWRDYPLWYALCVMSGLFLLVDVGRWLWPYLHSA